MSRLLRWISVSISIFLFASGWGYGQSTYLASGIDHSVARRDDGAVWAWGDNQYGQLGDGTLVNRPHPVQVILDTGEPLLEIRAVASRGWHSVAIDDDYRVWAWGRGDDGQLGDGGFTSSSHPVQVVRESGSLLGGVLSVVCGQQHTLARRSDGTVWAWGEGNDGQIGDGEAQDTPRAVQVLRQVDGGGTTLLIGVEAVAAGRYHSLALRNGEVWAWGANNYGQVGAADNLPVYDVAVPVVRESDGLPVTNARAIAAGQYFSLALTTDGKLLAWGRNNNGQFGNGTTSGSNRAVEVSLADLGDEILERLVAGAEHVLALTEDGDLWGWGSNDLLQLGMPPADPYFSEVPIPLTDGGGAPLTGIEDIAAGKYFSLVAEEASRRVLSWGDNSDGQLGQGQPPSCDCWRAEPALYADGELFLITLPDPDQATGTLLSPTGTVSGTVTVTGDVQDPNGLDRVWVTFVADGPQLALCGSGASVSCTEDSGLFSVEDVDPLDYGATFGEITAALFVQDNPGNVVRVAEGTFVLEPADGAQTFTLTVVKQGDGDGSLTSTPAGIDCAVGCPQQSFDFPSNSEIEINAMGDDFQGFAGERCFGTGACTVILNRDLEVRATFQAESTFGVTSTSPIDGSTDVPTSALVVFYFDRDIQPGPAWDDITFRRADGEDVEFLSTIYSSVPDRLVLIPSGLVEGREYEVFLPLGAVSDLAGAQLPNSETLGFATVTEGDPRLFIAAFPTHLVEDSGTTVHVWFDRPSAFERTVELSATPASALDLPTTTLTFPPGEVVASFVANGEPVSADTTVALQASETDSGTSGINLVVGDVTSQVGFPFRYDSFDFVADDGGDGAFDAGEDAEFQLTACNDGTSSMSTTEACLSLVNAFPASDLRPTTECKQIGFLNPGQCGSNNFYLRSDFELPAGIYWVRIEGTSSTNDFVAYASVTVVNNALPDYDLPRSARGLTIVEPGEIVDQDYTARNLGDGVDPDLPELLFTVENEQGQVVLERRSFVDVRRFPKNFFLVFESPAPSGEYLVRSTINPPPDRVPETSFDNNDSEPFTFIVNRRVTLDPLGGPYVIDAGDTFSLPVTAQDPDGDPLSFVLLEAPAGMQISATGDSSANIEWTPTEPQGPFTHTVEVEVSDGFRHEDTGSFSIEVKRRTDLAVTKTASASTVVPGLPISYQVIVSHLGPASQVDASLVDDLDDRLVDPVWTCTATAGSSCTASGNGDIQDFDLHLLHGGSATYSVTATLADGAQGAISNSACAQPDPPVIDQVPDNDCDSVTVTVSALDFGDAPDQTVDPGWHYPVRLSEDGARHGIGALRLGAGLDGEADGQPSLLADGDDNAGDDEDGVVLSELVPGESATATVSASAAGFLSAWFDWNADGDWLDPGEQVLVDAPLVAGTNPTLALDVPPEAISGFTIVRFRFSSQVGLASHGAAIDGEVEDHRVEVSPPPVTALELTATPAPASLPEPGGSANVSVQIDNVGDTEAEVTSLVDQGLGDLHGQGTCTLPQILGEGAGYGCTYDAPFVGNAGDTPSRTVTALGISTTGTAEASDSATVTVTDVLPAVGVVKMASPTELSAPGGEVTFMVSVANTAGVEPETLTALVDDVHGDLNSQGSCAVPQVIGVAMTYSCQFTAMVNGASGDVEVDTVTATAEDDEGNSTQASDTATVTIVDAPADLAIDKTDGQTFVEPGGALTYTIRVENFGPSDVVGAEVWDPLPSGLGSCEWICSANQGACTSSGAGDLIDAVDLDGGGVATYTLDCLVDEDATGLLANTATVEVPVGVEDTDQSNNTSTDQTEVATPLFQDGFESGDLSAWSTVIGRAVRSLESSQAQEPSKSPEEE